MSRTMKDTGIPWVGSIPQNWKLGRVKQGFFRKKQRPMKKILLCFHLLEQGLR